MQFYIIHPNPETNAKLLPDYALKKVNVREGWQILSDIGHQFGVTWEGQYAKYNPYHVLTKSFWINKEVYLSFVEHYAACLNEYKRRFNKRTVWHDFYRNAYHEISFLDEKIIDKTIEQQNLDYLLNEKKRFLTDSDFKRFEEIIK